METPALNVETNGAEVGGGFVEWRKVGSRYEVRINGTQFGWCDTEGAVLTLVSIIREMRTRMNGGQK